MNSRIYLSQASIPDLVITIFKKLISFEFIFKSYIHFYKRLVGEYDILCFIVLILGAAGLIHALISTKKNTTAFLFLYFFIFTLTYPPVFSAVFRTLVKYHIFVRYYLSFTPVLIAGLAVGLYYALFFLSLLLKSKYRLSTRIRYLPHVFLLIIFLFSFYGNTQSLKQMYVTRNRNWKKLYELFKYHSAPGDTAYIINLVRPGKARRMFITKTFYYKDETERHVRLRGGRGLIVRDYQNICSGKQQGNVYFVVAKGDRKIKKSYFKNFDDISIRRLPGLFIFRLLNRGNLPEKILSFFDCLAGNLRQKEHNYIVYETLFNLEMANRNLSKAKQHLDTLERIALHRQLKSRIEKFKKRWESISALKSLK